MARGEDSAVLGDVRTLFAIGALTSLSDQQLLDRFASRVDETAEAAFAGLVARHGPMVLRICRRTLSDPNDVSDAFQATFLVLVRKAESIRAEGSLGPWLYGVSRRVAVRARLNSVRRSARESRGVELASTPPHDPTHRELGAILDDEISRLPKRFRDAVLLCDMAGLSCDEAAHQIGCPVGTVKSRLSRARETLRSRLTRRGVAPSILAMSEVMHERAVQAAVPASLMAVTVSAAMSTTTGVGVVQVGILELTEGVLRSMLLTKLRIATVGTAALFVSITGAAVLAQQLIPPTESGSDPTASQTAEPNAQPQVAGGVSAEPAPTEVTTSVVLRPFVDRAWYAIFSPDGKWLVAGTNLSGAIRIYDAASHEEVGYLQGEAKTSYGCATFSPDGRWLVTSGGVRILVWNFVDRKLQLKFTAHEGGIRSLAFSPDGKTLASSGDDKRVHLWETGNWQKQPQTISSQDPIFFSTYSPDGKTLAVATGDYKENRPPRVALYNVSEGVMKERINLPVGEKGPTWSVAFSPDGKTLASSSFDSNVRLWDLETGDPIKALPLPEPYGARGLAFTPDGKTLAAGLGDGSIAVWDVDSGRQTLSLRGHREHIFTVAISPDGKTLASASRDGTVRLWTLPKSQ